MSAVVTGANGFAGRWLCSLLADEGVDVHGWVRNLPEIPIKGVNYHIADVRDRERCETLMQSSEAVEVYHLAAMTHLGACEASPADAVSTNVDGTRNVLESMPPEATGVFVSTCHVYGRPQSLPISELHPIEPTGVYAKTKAEAEVVALGVGRKVVVARSFHHTGPGQEERYALADWSSQIRRGVDRIPVGDLSLQRDYCDVRDIVAGYVLLCRKGSPGDTYNLCSGESHRLKTMFDWMSKDANAEPMVVAERIREHDVAEFRGDPTKAEQAGWMRRWELRHTLRQMAGLTD